VESEIQSNVGPETPQSIDGRTRSPDAPLNEGVAKSYREVQPAGFKDHARSSIEAAVVDPDVDDSEGGE
jgi:hypothetical protein